MKKGVLVYLLCLLVYVCTAQEEPRESPLANHFPVDTSSPSPITDLFFEHPRKFESYIKLEATGRYCFNLCCY